MRRAVRTLVPIAVTFAAATLVPGALAAAPVPVEVALAPGAPAGPVIARVGTLHIGRIGMIRPLHVLVVQTRRPAALIARLRGEAGIAAAARATVMHPADDTETDVDPGTGILYSWAYDAVDAGRAIAAVGGGSSFPVGVVDTGVDLAAPDLAGRISALRYDTASGGDNVTDVVGHGTMVAGVIAMVDGNGIGGRGIAGNTQIVPIRVTTSGIFFSDAVAKSIVWAVDHGIRIINLSLGGNELQSPSLTRAMAYAVAHDTLLVAAAGNDGDRGDATSYPAASLGAEDGGWSAGLSVGATRPDGLPASFSTYNDFVSVAAPGAGEANCPGGVFSTLPSEGQHTFADDPANCDSLFGAPESPVTGRYAYAQGTSFSAPIVSAVASLVLQANPGLHAAQIADVIRKTAHQTVGTGWNPHTGSGVVDALAAVTLARQYDTVAPALSFVVVRTGTSVSTTLTSVDSTGPGELPAGPGPETVSVSTDDKTFHAVASPTPTAPQSLVRVPPGARIWIRGTACDALHNCTNQDVGPFAGAPASAPVLKLGLSGYPGKVFRLRVQLGALQNSYTAKVRLEAWDGTAYRLFQTLSLPFGKTVIAREHVPYTGPLRLRARLIAGPLWHQAASSLVVTVK
jgi:subtilisin family serine protease